MICTKKKYLYKKVKQNGIPAALALILVLTMTGCTSAKTPELKDAIHKTAAYEQETVTDPVVGSLGGEWTVIALARSEENVDSNYFEKYRANVEKYLKEQDGILSENKYTEYSRVILALTAIGEDASDIGRYDLKEKLGLTYIFITHDLTSVTYLCDDVLFLYHGRITEHIPVSRIAETKDDYARKLLASIIEFN